MSSGKDQPSRRQSLTEKFIQNGFTLDGMSEEDLIYYVLDLCVGKNSALLAEKMSVGFGSLRDILAAPPAELFDAGVANLREVSKIRLVNAVMVNTEIQKLGKTIPFGDEQKLFRYLELLFMNSREETVYVIPLKKKMLGTPIRFATGAETRVGLDAGKLIDLLKNCVSCSEFIICHNHPNDLSAPSEADITSTEQLFGTASMSGYTLVEHYVVGTDGVSKVPFGRNLLKYFFKS